MGFRTVSEYVVEEYSHRIERNTLSITYDDPRVAVISFVMACEMHSIPLDRHLFQDVLQHHLTQPTEPYSRTVGDFTLSIKAVGRPTD